MQSYEVLKESVGHAGVKALSSRLNVSGSLLYKWCQPSDAPDASGSANPLDRIMQFCDATGETAPVEWLCEQCNGFFCRNPEVEMAATPVGMVGETRRVVREFSELLDAITEGLEDDEKVFRSETARIRKEWEDLKAIGHHS
jgi:hypothetical protein